MSLARKKSSEGPRRSISGSNINPDGIRVVNGTTKVVAGLDRVTFAQLLAAEKDALERMGQRRGSKSKSNSPGKKKIEKKKSGSNLQKRRGSLRDSIIGGVVVQTETFRKVAGISSVELNDGAPAAVTIDLDKKSGDTSGVFLRQGDGFDRDTGIFVSRLEMGSAAETMGMHVGDEVIKVNGVDVSQSEIARVEMLMSVVDIVALTIARNDAAEAPISGMHVQQLQPLPQYVSTAMPTMPPAPAPMLLQQQQQQQPALVAGYNGGPMSPQLSDPLSPQALAAEAEVVSFERGVVDPQTEWDREEARASTASVSSVASSASLASEPDRSTVQATYVNTVANSTPFPIELASPLDPRNQPKAKSTKRRSVQWDLPEDQPASVVIEPEPQFDRPSWDMGNGHEEDRGPRRSSSTSEWESRQSSRDRDRNRDRDWSREGGRNSGSSGGSGGVGRSSSDSTYERYTPSQGGKYDNLFQNNSGPKNDVDVKLSRLLSKVRDLKERSPANSPHRPGKPGGGEYAASSPGSRQGKSAGSGGSSLVGQTKSAKGAVVTIDLAYNAGSTNGVVETIAIDKSGGSLGLKIAGGAETHLGALFVAQIRPGSAADVDGRVNEGDRILSVQGVETLLMSQPDLVRFLKAVTEDVIEFELMRIGPKQWSTLQGVPTLESAALLPPPAASPAAQPTKSISSSAGADSAATARSSRTSNRYTSGSTVPKQAVSSSSSPSTSSSSSSSSSRTAFSNNRRGSGGTSRSTFMAPTSSSRAKVTKEPVASSKSPSRSPSKARAAAAAASKALLASSSSATTTTRSSADAPSVSSVRRDSSAKRTTKATTATSRPTARAAAAAAASAAAAEVAAATDEKIAAAAASISSGPKRYGSHKSAVSSLTSTSVGKIVQNVVDNSDDDSDEPPGEAPPPPPPPPMSAPPDLDDESDESDDDASYSASLSLRQAARAKADQELAGASRGRSGSITGTTNDLRRQFLEAAESSTTLVVHL